MGVKTTQKGHGRLFGPDGALISSHSFEREAFEKASFLPDGVYTFVPATLEYRVMNGAAVPAPAPVHDDAAGIIAEGDGELLPGASRVANPAPLPAPTDLLRLWDGKTGVTADYWNLGLRAKWRNRGGDWLDAAGAPQGAVPFAEATVPVTAPQLVALDVKKLVEHWLQHGNAGAWLKTSQACNFHSRETAEADKRPLLRVVTDLGSVDCACLADATLSTSTVAALGQQATFSAAGGAAIQFDLSAVTGTVQSATLLLWLKEVFSTPAIVLRAFRLDPPRLFSGAAWQGSPAPADLLLATDFSGDWARHFKMPGFTPNFAQTFPNPAFGQDAGGATWIEGRFSAAQGVVGGTLEYLFRKDGAEPEEAWFGYVVRLGADWGSTVDGNKMPGLAGRYGRKQQFDDGTFYWTHNEGGNGGNATTGKKDANGILSGWSLRGFGHVTPADGNPYKHLTPVGTYAYWADMPKMPDGAGYGQNWDWSHPTLGQVVLEHGRDYHIEQHVKLNSIAGPFDEFGNGLGNADGEFRAWLDGVLVFEKTGLRFRHHPDIKIEEVWLDWYHGGVAPAVATHHFRMNRLTVAKSRIGTPAILAGDDTVASPVNDNYQAGAGEDIVGGRLPTFPSWVPSPGNKANVDLNRLWQVDYAPSATQNNRGSEWYSCGDGQDGRFIEWTGACFAPDYSQYGAMLYYGGGHSGSQYSKLAVFDFSTRLWAEKGEQLDMTAYGKSYSCGHKYRTGQSFYPSGFQAANGEVPISEHTYANPVYVPAAAAGNQKGWWVYAVAWRVGAWGMDLDHLDDADGGKFSLTTDLGPQANGAYGAACFDSRRNRIWAIFSGPSVSNELYYLDIVPGLKTQPGAWKRVSTAFWSRPNWHNTLTYVPEHDCLIAFSPGFNQSNNHVAYSANVLNLNGSSTPADWTAWTPTQVATPAPTIVSASAGFEWCPLTGKFYCYPGFGGRSDYSTYQNCVDYVYVATPSGWSSGATWTWDQENFAGPVTPLAPPLTPGGQIPSGQMPITRFRWNPVLKSFMWATHRDGPVQLWRPQGA